jgi:ABC-2 type transport system permease protein
MKKYLAYFNVTLKDSVAYKADIILGLIIDVVFFFISFALWKTIYSEGGISQIDTYSLKDTITYYFIAAIIFRFDVANSIYLNWMIWSGYFTNDLIKPWNIPLVNIIGVIADRGLVFILYIPIMLIILLFTHSYIQFPIGINILFFTISLAIAFFLNCFFNLIFHSLAFKFGDQDANIEFFTYIGMLLAGGVFPLAFLPESIKHIFNILPFKFLFSFPIEVLLGKVSMADIMTGWITAILWTVCFYLIFIKIYRNGLKYYTGTGR